MPRLSSRLTALWMLSVLQAASAGLLRKTNDQETAPKDVKVQVQLFDEALCIGCKHFVTEQLVPTFDILGPAIMEIDVIPFGNAMIDVDSKLLKCQHGEAECDANSYEQCASDIFPIASRYLPFIDCLYKVLPMGHADDPFDASIFAGCAKEAAMDWSTIKECHDDEERAWQLQVAAAQQTPEHQYVPWVVINGETIDMNQEFDLLSYVCQAYMKAGGTNPACKGFAVAVEQVASSY